MKRLFSILILSVFTACVNPSNTANKGKVIDSMASQISKKYSDVSHMTVQEYKNKKQAGEKVILVDVRPAKETNISMIPGAITLGEFEKDKEKYHGHTVVTYCTIGYRSSITAKKLSAQGFKTHNLKGSILSWAQNGGEFVHEQKKTKKAHVYAEAWNLLPEGYEGVYD